MHEIKVNLYFSSFNIQMAMAHIKLVNYNFVNNQYFLLYLLCPNTGRSIVKGS